MSSTEVESIRVEFSRDVEVNPVHNQLDLTLSASDSLKWAEPVSSRTVANSESMVSLETAVSEVPSRTCVSSQSSLTCFSASSATVKDLIQPCTLWGCPIDLGIGRPKTSKCLICLQNVSPASLLPCSTCHQAGCVYCHLKNLSGRSYNCRHDALLLEASCFFCRAPYCMYQLRQLHLIYRAHKGQLGFPLWVGGEDNESPDVRSQLYREVQRAAEQAQGNPSATVSWPTVRDEITSNTVSSASSTISSPSLTSIPPSYADNEAKGTERDNVMVQETMRLVKLRMQLVRDHMETAEEHLRCAERLINRFEYM